MAAAAAVSGVKRSKGDVEQATTDAKRSKTRGEAEGAAAATNTKTVAETDAADAKNAADLAWERALDYDWHADASGARAMERREKALVALEAAVACDEAPVQRKRHFMRVFDWLLQQWLAFTPRALDALSRFIAECDTAAWDLTDDKFCADVKTVLVNAVRVRHSVTAQLAQEFPYTVVDGALAMLSHEEAMAFLLKYVPSPTPFLLRAAALAVNADDADMLRALMAVTPPDTDVPYLNNTCHVFVPYAVMSGKLKALRELLEDVNWKLHAEELRMAARTARAHAPTAGKHEADVERRAEICALLEDAVRRFCGTGAAV